jgi:hypothetical protein
MTEIPMNRRGFIGGLLAAVGLGGAAKVMPLTVPTLPTKPKTVFEHYNCWLQWDLTPEFMTTIYGSGTRNTKEDIPPPYPGYRRVTQDVTVYRGADGMCKFAFKDVEMWQVGYGRKA